MCGIAGFATDAPGAAGRLRDALAHRGPDGAWVADGPIGLVQTRLSVIDLSDRVRYPMRNEAGDLRLLFNGEVYDHAALRAQLRARGHVFATDCDAEVVLHGYEEWGDGCFARLSGMFAVALIDDRTGEVVLARDALGIKPLVHTTGSRFAFASDALALVEAGLSDGVVDPGAIEEFLAFHYVPPPLTGIADVRQVEPGTLVRRRADGTTTVRRWHAPPFAEPAPPPERSLEDVLVEAVARHLVADVDVGVLLSGGTDSRLVLALAVAAGARPPCFTISFAGHGDYDEAPAAARTARALGVDHHVERLSAGFDEALAMTAAAFDTPFADASAIATLAVSRRASEHVKVVLTGTGGDDLFGGYARHRAHLLHRHVAAVPARLRELAVRAAVAPGTERRSAAALGRSHAARLAAAADAPPLEQYLALVASHTSQASLQHVRVPASTSAARRRVAERHELGRGGEGGVLRAIQAFELRTYLPGDLLAKEDRATMAFGVEGRVPLLDPAVVAVAAALPDAAKASLLTGKRPLRKLARQHLPPVSGGRRKRGFAVPLGDLFAGPWRAASDTFLREAPSALVDGAGVAADERLAPAERWAFAVLVAWEQRVAAARVALR